MLTELQKRAAMAIVNIFETGRVLGNYAKVTYVPGDRGQLTYGRSQTTLASGGLYRLLRVYCEQTDASFDGRIASYLPQLERKDPSLNTDLTFRALLQAAGEDPVMHAVQDRFFEASYWRPAVAAAEALGLKEALSVAVVYDGFVHGSWARIRDRTCAAHGKPAAVGERAWIGHYLQERRAWLAAASSLLARTVYRMDAFLALVRGEKWDLALPLVVRGLRIDESSLELAEPARISGHDDDERDLYLCKPRMTGPAVKAVQEALTRHCTLSVDGVYGPLTERAVRAFQVEAGLVPDGVVGPATRQALGL